MRGNVKIKLSRGQTKYLSYELDNVTATIDVAKPLRNNNELHINIQQALVNTTEIKLFT